MSLLSALLTCLPQIQRSKLMTTKPDHDVSLEPITTHGEYAMDGSEQYITYAKQGNIIIWSSGWTTRNEAIRRLTAFNQARSFVNLVSSKGQDHG